MKRWFKYIKPYLPAFILGPLCMIVEVIGEVVMPKLLASIIDYGISGKEAPPAVMWLYNVFGHGNGFIAAIMTGMILTALLMMIGGVGGAWFGAKASVSFASDLRRDVYRKVQKFSFANIDKFQTGSLVTRLTNDITQVQNFINTLLRMALRAPGMLIGAKGAEIEKLRAEISKIAGGKDVNLNIVEVKNPDMNAKLVAENIAMQLEQRVSFRRAMKSCIGRTMKSGAKGIKTMVSGRLGGAEIARSENYHEGTIPLQTLRADIDYGVARANTTYGVIGVKVWIYKGEVLKGEIPAQRTTEKPRRRNNDNRSRRPRVEKKEGGND